MVQGRVSVYVQEGLGEILGSLSHPLTLSLLLFPGSDISARQWRERAKHSASTVEHARKHTHTRAHAGARDRTRAPTHTPTHTPTRPPRPTKANTKRTVSAPSRWQETASASPNRATLQPAPHRGRGPARLWPSLYSSAPGPLPPPCQRLKTLFCHQQLGQARGPLARGWHWHAHRASPLCPRARDRPQAPSLGSGR